MGIKSNDIVVSPYNMGSNEFLYFFIANKLVPQIEQYRDKESTEYKILFFCDNKDRLDKAKKEFADYLKKNYTGVYTESGTSFPSFTHKHSGKIEFKRLKSTIYPGMIFAVDVCFILFDSTNRINEIVNSIASNNIISVFDDLSYKENNEFILEYVLQRSAYVFATHIIKGIYSSVYDYLYASDNMLVKLMNKKFTLDFYSDLIPEAEDSSEETIIL